MKNHLYTIKTAAVGIVISVISFSYPAQANLSHHITVNQQDSLTTAGFLQQASVLGTKALLTGKLAFDKGTDKKIKSLGQMMVVSHTKANEELRTLAKLKKVDLPMSLPEGGQRPDGRVDSSPENLRDTSRTKNAAGEAGNTGQSKKTGYGEADVSNATEKLKGLNGTAFDQAYIEMTVADHQNAIKLFEKASQSTDNAIKAYANKYLPELKKHLKQANALAGK